MDTCVIVTGTLITIEELLADPLNRKIPPFIPLCPHRPILNHRRHPKIKRDYDGRGRLFRRASEVDYWSDGLCAILWTMRRIYVFYK